MRQMRQCIQNERAELKGMTYNRFLGGVLVRFHERGDWEERGITVKVYGTAAYEFTFADGNDLCFE